MIPACRARDASVGGGDFSLDIYSHLAKQDERNCRDEGRSRPAHQSPVGTRDYTSASTRLAYRENLNIAEGSAPDLIELKQDVAPEKVLDKIEEEAIAQARGDRNQEVG